MPTGQPENSTSYLWLMAAGLTLYCVMLTLVTGDIGFNGDDWWVLAYPYWHSFPDALTLYAHKFLRPLEGFYWISLFKVFGFNKLVFHLCSLMLLAGSAVLMGVALDRAFPGRRSFISIAVLLAFFLPPVSCLTYVMFTDNSRLSVLLFWTSVIAFQRWAQKSSPWRGLMLPTACYVASFLTYEASSFLIFLVPLLAWPVHQRCVGRTGDRAFLAKLCTGILAAFTTALAIRFVFLNGGAVSHSSLVPSFELLWAYPALLPWYLVAPFTSISADRWAVLAGLLVALWTAGIFLLVRQDRPGREVEAPGRLERGPRWHLIAVGAGILILGMLPYQLAGYGSFSPRLVETLMAKSGSLPENGLSWFNFTWASRIYSSASFGVAILLACALTAWRRPSARLIGKAAALVVIGFMAVFHAGLSQDWREAAEIHSDLVRSLVSQVPAVKAGTHFVFLDVACSHKRAEVIRQENGLRELVQMLYTDQTLAAWRLYPDAYNPSTQARQQAVATPEGFRCAPGQRQCELARPRSLLLFKRSGRELILLNKITCRDGVVPTGIAWRGIEHLDSNLGLIEGWADASAPRTRLARTAWSSGLIPTLKLTRLKSTVTWPRIVKHTVVRNPLRRRLLKTRVHQFGTSL